VKGDASGWRGKGGWAGELLYGLAINASEYVQGYFGHVGVGADGGDDEGGKGGEDNVVMLPEEGSEKVDGALSVETEDDGWTRGVVERKGKIPWWFRCREAMCELHEATLLPLRTPLCRVGAAAAAEVAVAAGGECEAGRAEGVGGGARESEGGGGGGVGRCGSGVSLSADQLLGFYNDTYCASSIDIFIAGDVRTSRNSPCS
jgi:hypothetical protein